MSLEAIAREYEDLRGDIITEAGWDMQFAALDGDDHYTVIPDYWTSDGTRLLAQLTVGEAVGQNPVLDTTLEMWSDMAASRGDCHEPIDALVYDSTIGGYVHMDPNTQLIHTTPLRQLHDAKIRLYPAVTTSTKKWDVPNQARYRATGPHPQYTVTKPYRVGDLVQFDGQALEAYSLWNGQVIRTSIPHAIIDQPGSRRRNLAVSHY